ncbi:MAG: hypothetical protein OEZ68_10485 [Gammaproteobacteria bacterium]|nr:hypothetical protein [Gammaproteobacteria bacterium]MDH5801218.1 hypothetical protein [Gammaproteobacteria bacterium]
MKEVIRKVLSWLDKVGNSIFSLALVVVMSKRGVDGGKAMRRECIILGNGPSLSIDLVNNPGLCAGKDIVCVNYFALSEIYEEIMPNHYVVLDPDIWDDNLKQGVEDRDKFIEYMCSKTKWELNFFIPVEARRSKVFSKLSTNSNININLYNRTPVDGFGWLVNGIYKRGLGMPRPYNVLVASIFLAINMGYEKVYFVGADHSWHEDILVGKDNVLYVRQHHFYDDAENVVLTPFFNAGDKGVFDMHQVFSGWAKLYYSYKLLRHFADKSGVSVLNASSKSYIDSFDRTEL